MLRPSVRFVQLSSRERCIPLWDWWSFVPVRTDDHLLRHSEGIEFQKWTVRRWTNTKALREERNLGCDDPLRFPFLFQSATVVDKSWAMIQVWMQSVIFQLLLTLDMWYVVWGCLNQYTFFFKSDLPGAWMFCLYAKKRMG